MSVFPIVLMNPTTTPSIFAVASAKVPPGPARIISPTIAANRVLHPKSRFGQRRNGV
jgi:hypothetical protein